MRLQYVRPFPRFSWTCARCGKNETTDGSSWATNPVADLDGVPFRAYYHTNCAMVREWEHERAHGMIAPWVEQQPIDTAH